MMHVEFTDAEGRAVYAATVCDPPKPAEGDRIEVLYDPSRPGSGALPATRAGRFSPLPRIVLAIGAGLLVLAVVVGWDFYRDLAGLIGFLLR